MLPSKVPVKLQHLCFLPGMLENDWITFRHETISSRSFFQHGLLCLSAVLLHLNSEQICFTTPIDLPALLIALAVKLAPVFLSEAFIERFMCSVCRSRRMLHPCLPLILIKCEYSCLLSLVKSNCSSIRNFAASMA